MRCNSERHYWSRRPDGAFQTKCDCGAVDVTAPGFDSNPPPQSAARTRITRDWINDRAKVAGEQIRAALAEFERETGATARGVHLTHAHPYGLDPHLALAEVEWKLL